MKSSVVERDLIVIYELQIAIDSLDVAVNNATAQSYGPLLRENIFRKDIQVTQLPDSMKVDKTGYVDVNLLDTIANLSIYDKNAEIGKAPEDDAAKPSIAVEENEQGN